ncbi:MAG: DUF2339 domain-containing protein [Thermonemataceae bacterium]
MQRDQQVKILQERVENLSKVLERYREEITALRQAITALEQSPTEVEETPSNLSEEETVPLISIQQDEEETTFVEEAPTPRTTSTTQRSLEDYIGGNLISKVGIAILVVGLGIFVKYAIDQNLINETLRIVLSYVAGGLLLGASWWTKKKYTAYSAVLFSGAVAVGYFTTFIAFDFYQFYPQWLTLLLMLLISALTVYGAILYQQQIIGIVGLVGAYAVPLLVSDQSGEVVFFFSYVAFINTIILVVSFKQQWKATQWVAFFTTWLLFGSWFVSDTYYTTGGAQHKNITLIFSVLYGLIFLAITLVDQLYFKQPFKANSVLLLLINAFFLYIIGMAVLSTSRYEQSVFTFLNAVAYGLIAAGSYALRPMQRTLFYTLCATAIGFLVIWVPEALDGNWIPALWAVIAVGVWWVGRKQVVGFFETGALLLMSMSLIGLVILWLDIYYAEALLKEAQEDMYLFGNSLFFTSLLIAALLAVIIWMHDIWPAIAPNTLQLTAKTTYTFALIAVTYLAFYHEIHYFFEVAYQRAIQQSVQQASLQYQLQRIWLINYTLLYLGVFQLLNVKFLQAKAWQRALTLVIIISTLLIFFSVAALESISNQAWLVGERPPVGLWLLSFLIFAFPLAVSLRWGEASSQSHSALIVAANLLAIIGLSTTFTRIYVELAADIDTLSVVIDNSRRFGYSILWGIYAFTLVAYGFWKKRKLHRIIGISLLGITLGKLFLRDLNYESTVSKIITFIIIGVLLLIVSFLYQKFKPVILAADEQEQE